MTSKPFYPEFNGSSLSGDSDLLKRGSGQPHGPTGANDSLETAPPLLDEAEFVEDAADDPVAELRDAVEQLLYRQAEGQEARVFDLETIVEYGEADRTARLRVVGMSNCVHDGLG